MKFLFIPILSCFFSTNLQAQQKPRNITNLVFEGAGIRGIAYCGVVAELEEAGMMSTVKKTAGTSAGAIVALLVSLGYTGKELQEIIGGTNFRKFNDGHFLFAGGINRLKRYFGWYRGNSFERWLKNSLHKKPAIPILHWKNYTGRGLKIYM